MNEIILSFVILSPTSFEVVKQLPEMLTSLPPKQVVVKETYEVVDGYIVKTKTIRGTKVYNSSIEWGEK